MFTRRSLIKTSLSAGAAIVASSACSGLVHAAGTGLNWAHFPAGPNEFFRAPVLVSGTTEAVLIDGGFTLSGGRALAEEIKATGKRLTSIYISQSDPDFYFSLAPIAEAFPEAKVLASSETINAIKANVAKKIAVWGKKLGENGPQSVDDVVMPEAYDAATLSLEGKRIEITPAAGLANRRYLWVPELQAVFGGVMVFSGVHVWTADTPGKEARAAWVANLDQIIARRPAVVVPGHMSANAAMGIEAVEFTKAYLIAFEEELARAGNSEALVAAMNIRFPDLDMGVALNIGAKVATGEMKWG